MGDNIDNKRESSGGSTQIIEKIRLSAPDNQNTPTLIIMRGTDTGKIFKLTHPSMSLGREKSTDICINDNTISRKHCLLVSSAKTIMLIDLGSSNGTLINGSKINKQKLNNGDKITVGQTVLRFEIADNDVEQYHDSLYKQITFDDLTSLYNSKTMYKELETSINAIPDSLPFSVLFMDIDHFKKVNDNYGHITGSKILADLGRLFLSNLRSIDIACRYGGEEFVMIITQCDLDKAHFVAEKLRKLIENHRFATHNGEPLHITISIGVAEATNAIKSGKELIDMADRAMYQAKSNGRNNTVLYRDLDPGDNEEDLYILK